MLNTLEEINLNEGENHQNINKGGNNQSQDNNMSKSQSYDQSKDDQQSNKSVIQFNINKLNMLQDNNE